MMRRASLVIWQSLRRYRSYPARLVLLAAMLTLAACATTPLPPWPEQAPPYQYPFDNPWMATVVGTTSNLSAPVPTNVDPVRHEITMFPDRQIPEGYWYYRTGLQYSTFLQNRPAPLIFVISGTGGDDRTSRMTFLGRLLYARGFHVVLLPSPTHANFVVTGSSTFLPGRPMADAADLLRAMHAIRATLPGNVQVTSYGLTGYSLGAWHAAYVAKADLEAPDPFHFGPVLLLNPPVDLYRSMNKIHAMLYKGLPNGVEGVNTLLNRVVDRLSQAGEAGEALDFTNQDIAFALYQQTRPTDEQLATLIGLSFQFASMSMIFGADVMSHAGYIFPADRPYTSRTPTDEYVAVALRTSFLNYLDDMYVKYYTRHSDPPIDRATLIQRASLVSIEDFLSSHRNIGVITNVDDVILDKRDIADLQRIFGDRLQLFPNGGHMGNMRYAPFAWQITNFFTSALGGS